MPELPEVETITNDLRPLVVGFRIEEVDLRFPSIVRYPEPEAFSRGLAGRRVKSLRRRGKYMLFELDSPALLVVHLGMTGQLLHLPPDAPFKPHTHAVFSLEGGAHLRYKDPRRFGRLLLGTEEELIRTRQLPRLGPEPLSAEFTATELGRRLKGRRAAVKVMLLDQAVVAGVGNIYADEAAFRAGVRPDKPAGKLGRVALSRLRDALQEVLRMGIRNRGSSIEDYVDVWGAKGRQQEELHAYGRGGQPCVQCGKPLALIRLGGRATVFCRHCQR